MNETVKVGEENRKLFIACCIFSFLVLIASYVAQYGWKMEPCRLCKLQRIPYFFLLVLPLFGLLGLRYSWIKAAMICLLSVSLCLSFYHLLVIGGWVKDYCVIQTKPANIEEFMSLLEAHIPCSKAGWKLLGILASGYNLLLSSVFLVLFLRTKGMNYSHGSK